jgi:hypothetical protein
LACTTADGTAAKVKAGISTRAPGQVERLSDRKIAAEQEETASAYFVPMRSANSRSSRATGASSGAV